MVENITLSILIATIPKRYNRYIKLRKELNRQIAYCDATHPTLGLVEVLADSSRPFLEGGPSIGRKRNALVQVAEGKYLCFLDDDESISPNYIEALLRLCYQDKDVCTFRNVSKFDNYWCVVDMGLNNQNAQATPLGIVERKPWHICPVRSVFAKQFDFPDSNYGEDWQWFSKVLELCQTEAKTEEIIHQYNHSVHTSEADKISLFKNAGN